MKNITIRIDDEILKALKIKAEKDGRTLSSLIRKMIKENIDLT